MFVLPCRFPRSGIPAVVVAVMLSFAQVSWSQSNGSSKGSSGGGSSSGGNASSQKGQEGQNSSAAQSNSPASSTRVEADMLAYEASDKIAGHIASNVCGHKLVIYDAQTFTSMQAYEAYSGALKVFADEFTRRAPPPTGQIQPKAVTPEALQSIVGTITALKSSTDFQALPVNPDQDALIAQVANQVSASCSKKESIVTSLVVLPKILLLDDSSLHDADDKDPYTNCNSLRKTVPRQLSCVMYLRNQVVKDAKKDSDYLDKIFQAFVGTVLGVSTDSTVKPAKDTQQTRDDAGDSANAGAGQQASKTTDQNPTTPILASIIQGHRILSELKSSDGARLLVLEVSTAGGSYRVRHNFWVELFWTTPNPAFNGGAVVTYFLINPETSSIEKSEVLRYMFDYGKFKNLKKLEKGANFCPVGETCHE